MFFTKKVALASVAAVCATLVFAPIANAADARVGDCIHMAKQVREALDAAQPGAKTDTARMEQQAGASFCSYSLYEKGVAHYAKALELLKG